MKRLLKLLTVVIMVLNLKACNKDSPEIIDVNSPNATVTYPGDCGATAYIIKFDNGVQNLPQPNQNTYYELNLPEHLEVPNKRIYAEFRARTINDKTPACTTFGFGYPFIFITYAE